MAFTSDLRFIRKGDKGTVRFNVDFNDEYHVTKDRLYPATVIEDKQSALISYVNDIGVSSTIVYDYMSARDGYASIRMGVEDEEFKARVNALRASHTTVLETDHEQKLAKWNAYCDYVIEEAKKP